MRHIHGMCVLKGSDSPLPFCIRVMYTHIMSPNDFISSRIGLDFAIKIAIISLLDVLRIETGAELQGYGRWIYGERKREEMFNY